MIVLQHFCETIHLFPQTQKNETTHKLKKYSRLSVYPGSAYSYTTNQPGKYLERKISGSSKRQNLNLTSTSNYSHNNYIVFTTIYISFTLC